MKSLKFFLLVLALSIPFWILGAMAEDLTKILPIKLPISALMSFCPLLAALMLVYQESKLGGVKAFLKRAFDHRIKEKKWYIPIFFLMPILTLMTYWLMRMIGMPLPIPHISFLSVFIFCFVFLIGAVGEEVGWMGYVIDPLQNRWGAWRASIILGFIWAIWHIIPYSQAPQTPRWIFWQCISTVFLRVIMVWIYNNTGKSVVAMILFHTMINVSMFLFPNYGSHYDPAMASIFIVSTAVCVSFQRSVA